MVWVAIYLNSKYWGSDRMMISFLVGRTTRFNHFMHKYFVKSVCWDEKISIIQIYSTSVFFLILIASLMAYDAIHFFDMLRVLCTCGILIGIYTLFLRLSGRQEVATLLVISSLIALPIISYLKYLEYAIGMMGFAMLVSNKWKVNIHALYFMPLLFVAIFGSNIYSDFHYLNRLNNGSFEMDALFHAAIAAMYSHYGVTSIGLDGLVPISYHTLSHKILAGISILSGFEALATYSYLYFAMGPLLLVFSLAGLSCQLNSKLTFSQALLGISLILLSIIVIPIFQEVALWDSFFVSESYLISLVLLITSLSTLLRFFEIKNFSLIYLIISLILLVLSGLSKGSVGLVGICMFGLIGITQNRTFSYWATLIIATVVLYFGVIDSATSAKSNTPVLPFDFPVTYVLIPYANTVFKKIFFFVTLHFLPVLICFGIGIYRSGYVYLKSIEFQVLFALLVPAVFFSLTFKIGGGSAYYFSSVPVIMSLPFLLNRIAPYLTFIRFKYVIFIFIITANSLHNPIIGRSFMFKSPSHETRDQEFNLIVKQLQNIRDNSPPNILVKIQNPELLVSKIGCKAYWFFPAIIERPLIGNVPNKYVCPGEIVEYGFYGLSDYKFKNTTESKLSVENIKIGTLKD